MPKFYAVTATVGSNISPTVTDVTVANEKPNAAVFFIHDDNGERCIRRIWFENYAEADAFCRESKEMISCRKL